MLREGSISPEVGLLELGSPMPSHDCPLMGRGTIPGKQRAREVSDPGTGAGCEDRIWVSLCAHAQTGETWT